MTEHVDRCESCGQFVYVLRLWISGEDIVINAGTKKAFVIDDIAPFSVGGVPVLKLTEEIPAEVWTKHECGSSFQKLKDRKRKENT